MNVATQHLKAIVQDAVRRSSLLAMSGSRESERLPYGLRAERVVSFSARYAHLTGLYDETYDVTLD
ncbi:MAG: hypothetical protein IJR24_00465 [Alloprevotella sp.]|nr:hypothetical protein [Alloprevotella sp.]